MKSKLLPSVVLGVICLVVALLLAAVNSVTQPLIENAQEQKIQDTLSKVLPEGKNFKEIEIDGLSELITAAYCEDGGGYVFQMEVTGYKPGLVILCGIASDGNVRGADFITSKETLSAEVGLGEKYIGQNFDSFTPELITSATKTTTAYAEAIRTALDAFQILSEQEDAQ